MKQLTNIILVAVIAISILGCVSGNKSKQIKDYKYTEEKAAVTGALQKKIGAWIEEGMTCYGIIILTDKEGNAKKVKEIEAKIISIQPDKIKLKAMEDLVLAPVEGCTKTGIKKGETWDEKEGDLFQTRVQAINYIETKYPETQVIVK
ncbi:MAG: hypothetical protein M0R39_10865 [Prolixibacteraceae bacterium]|jgi:hypothetical protein|nr:hypothetical protein [Prolixibacteraceae bacterium]